MDRPFLDPLWHPVFDPILIGSVLALAGIIWFAVARLRRH